MIDFSGLNLNINVNGLQNQNLQGISPNPINNNFPLNNNNFSGHFPAFENTNLSSLTNEPQMTQIFKNNEITVYSAFIQSFDKTNVNGSFYISNIIDQMLNNVKMNLSVKKHVNCKVLSTSGTLLEPRKSLGIKKVIFN